MIVRIIKLIVIAVMLLLLVVLMQPVEPVMKKPLVKAFDFPDTLDLINWNLDSLERIVGPNRSVPSKYAVAGLLAFTAFPQLSGVRIDMELVDSGAPMESNFEFWTLFGPKSGRVYKILLHDGYNTPYDEILLRSLPLDAQVGILAHEIGHVIYYHELSTLQIAKWGLLYLLDEDFRSLHERSTDMVPVYHGLESQIYQYAHYIRNDPSCTAFYTAYGEFIDKYYLTDEELSQYLDE